MSLQLDKKFLIKYIKDLKLIIDKDKDYIPQLLELKNLIFKTKKNKKKLIFVGNGGSSATASHASVDFTKNAKIKSVNFNETDLITCFSNDYGYENWIKNSLKFYDEEISMPIYLNESSMNSRTECFSSVARTKSPASLC